MAVNSINRNVCVSPLSWTSFVIRFTKILRKSQKKIFQEAITSNILKTPIYNKILDGIFQNIDFEKPYLIDFTRCTFFTILLRQKMDGI